MKKIRICKTCLIVPVMLLAFGCRSAAQTVDWNMENEITSKIIPPEFPDKDFIITSYGAIGDGITDCTEAIRKAIEECGAQGGGRVVVQEGVFLTGAVHLKSNVNLYVSEGATLKFSTDPKKYLPVVFTRWEGVECYNYSPLIYAYEQENIAVTGEGILDGSGANENWWRWSGKPHYGWEESKPNQKADRDKLIKMGKDGVKIEERIFGEGYHLRPAFLQPYKCKNVLIQGVTLKDSPMWFINPVLCEYVTVDNVTVEGLGPNNDGCDPESSKYVWIKNSYFNTGDDCIAIKSGRNNDGRRVNVPSENIVIQNCQMKEGHGGVVIGSEISGGARNIFVSDCKMDSPNLDRALRFKTNSVRGGLIENYFARDIEIGQVKEAALHINFFYEEGDAGNFPPTLRSINLKNITCQNSPYAIWIRAYEYSPVTNLNIENCRFYNVQNNNVMENVKDITMKDVHINNEEITIK
ncbi:MAG TPA: glycoside hydrolase family 28 protein [Ignavibacteriales bacterium]|nr:glycoside hydrolase family 28 protein [Ignavibacteriales bacterium]